ncbi:MAG: phytoene desaturase [Marinoscillum sp.]|jgi:phytoene desaturase
MSLKIGVIGSGVAGLATAIRLAVAGNQVEVFEANDYPGGKLSQITSNGYRFDAGPSLFTLPALVDELFELSGENANEYFNYLRLEINCKYFYPDETVITAFAQPDKFIQEVCSKTHEKPENLKKAIKQSANLYHYLSDLFMFSSLNDWRTFFSKKALKAYLNIHKLGFLRSMNGANKAQFDDDRVVQMFNRYATYNGSSPYKTPATMNIIPHLEMSLGAYFPKGGMHAITFALFELAKRQGVKFSFGKRVDEIILSGGKIEGIRLADQILNFDRVVSNMDVVNTYKKLLPNLKAPRFLLNQPKSSSALIFYWGIKTEFHELDLHNIFFSDDYRSEFDHIFNKGTCYKDPTVYVNITSKYQSDDAPKGCENWFTMVNVPNNQGQDWDSMIEEARANILRKLSKQLGVEIAPLIETEQILDPRTIESKTSSALGALYGNSSNNLFSAFLRHANVSKRVSGLFFCGGSVHPGGGIPMSLASAKLVAKYFR